MRKYLYASLMMRTPCSIGASFYLSKLLPYLTLSHTTIIRACAVVLRASCVCFPQEGVSAGGALHSKKALSALGRSLELALARRPANLHLAGAAHKAIADCIVLAAHQLADCIVLAAHQPEALSCKQLLFFPFLTYHLLLSVISTSGNLLWRDRIL